MRKTRRKEFSNASAKSQVYVLTQIRQRLLIRSTAWFTVDSVPKQNAIPNLMVLCEAIFFCSSCVKLKGDRGGGEEVSKVDSVAGFSDSTKWGKGLANGRGNLLVFTLFFWFYLSFLYVSSFNWFFFFYFLIFS